jgi:hypothetical protein
MKSWKSSSMFVLSAALLLAMIASPAMAVFNAPNYGGTARIPGGGYVSPADIHAWLRAGGVVTAEMRAYHGVFGVVATTPGGTLGGQVENYSSSLVFTITGTGPLQGWSRTVVVPANCETHLAPRKIGDPVQDFDTNMYRIEGGITNDPDFEYFQVTAGTGDGFDSPGHTTLYQQKDGSWLVDSNFQIGYQIKYKGAAGGKLDGVEDVATGTITMTAVPADPNMEAIAKGSTANTTAAKAAK